MKIKPAPSPAASPRSAAPGGAARPREGARAVAAPGDRLAISAEARALSGEGLDPARLAALKQKIADGHYDEPRVRSVLIERLLEVLRRA